MSRKGNWLALFFLIIIVFWNCYQLKKPIILFPQSLKNLGIALRISQSWSMFSPDIAKDDGWFVMKGIQKNGTRVELINVENAIPWEKPQSVQKMYKNVRWNLYLSSIWRNSYRNQRKYFSHYICRKWNADTKGEEQLSIVQLYYMEERTLPNNRLPKPKKHFLIEYDCLKDQEVNQ